MTAKKGGLGRGLDALFTDNATSEHQPVELRLSEIEPNRAQPRKDFDENALQELADSIVRYGVLQPLLVRPMAMGIYQLVAGERRWRAARMAGLDKVPAIIRDMDDTETMEIALIENLQREDLNPVEEAQGYRVLMEEYGLTQETVAERVGKSRPAVANAVRLLGLPDYIQAQLREGRISAGHARALLAFENADEQAKAAEAAAEGATVREIERMAKAAARTPAPGAKKQRRDPYYEEVELALSASAMRRVRVVEGRGRTFLEVEVFDKTELAALANCLAELF